jgi:hypothetical protein
MNILPTWFVITVGSTALGLWVAQFVAALMIPHYKPDPNIGYCATLVVGACFTTGTVQVIVNRIRQNAERRAREENADANSI